MKLKIVIGLSIISGILIETHFCDSRNSFNARKRRQDVDIAQCRPGFYYSNGWCYPSFQNATCPEGFQLHNNMCYPKELKPCPFDSTTSTTTTTTTELPSTKTTTTTLPTTTTTTTLPTTTTTLPTTTTTTTLLTTTTTLPTTTTTLPTTTTTTLPTTTTTLPTTTALPTTTTALPTTTQIAPTTASSSPLCPEGCELRENQKCCDCSSISTTTQTAPTTDYPAPSENIQCPYGSIFLKGECREIICPMGEYVNGQCIQFVCPEGTVWRGSSCQEPRLHTTILEIENVIITEARDHPPGKIDRINSNNITYYTERPDYETFPDESTTPPPPPSEIISAGCCTIFTPRVCKKYGKKWICFNNRLKRCDRNVCKFPTIYLKTPQVVYEPPILIMPPNPPLLACPTPNCDAKEIVDCSGCPEGRRERCSPYCYKYICPQGTCGYIEHQKFCQSYPGVVGCRKKDGCIWGWCGEN